MRWLLVVGLLVGCGGEPPECGTSIAEALFIETALTAYDHAFGPPAQPSGTCAGGGTSTVEGTSAPTSSSPRVDDYKVTFQDCKTLDGQLAFNGTVHLVGTWVGATDAAYCDDCMLTADSLMIRGTEE